MSSCRHCAYYMIHLSDKLRMINERSEKDGLLQDDIKRLMSTLDGHGHASNVAHVLHQDIQGASLARLVPLLQCVVRCVIRLQGDVMACFEHWLPDTMEEVFESLCEKKHAEAKSGLMLLRFEWNNDVFSRDTLSEIDKRLRLIDGNWPMFKSENARSKATTSLPEKFKWMLPPMTHKSFAPTRSPAYPSPLLGYDKPSPSCSPTWLRNNNDKPSPTWKGSYHKPLPTQSPRVSTTSKPSPVQALSRSNGKPSPRVTTSSEASVKERDRRSSVSSSARYQPLEFIKPPNSRQLTTETRLRQTNVGGNSSDKENDGAGPEFFQQFFNHTFGYTSF